MSTETATAPTFLRVDVTGLRFGRLLALRPVGKNSQRVTLWSCVCDCGATTSVALPRLRKGETRSCGCLARDVRLTVKVTHGLSVGGRRDPLLRIWAQMIQRCTNPRDKSYCYYGGRGITVCERWRHDVAAFVADIGPRPTARHSIDRIDNDGNYEPGNVRWATKSQQRRNQRGSGR